LAPSRAAQRSCSSMPWMITLYLYDRFRATGMPNNGAPYGLLPFPRTYDTSTRTSEEYLPLGGEGFLPRTVNEVVLLSNL
jgi:hypothetical protein